MYCEGGGISCIPGVLAGGVGRSEIIFEVLSFTCICFSRCFMFLMYCLNWLIIFGLFIIHLCIK